MSGVVVSLFDSSGVMVEPWLADGCRAVCVDLEPSRRDLPGVEWVKQDARHWFPKGIRPEEVRFVSAFPPCDHLAVSGARWFAGKGLRKLAEAIELFAVAADWCEWFGAPYIIENPVSTISSYWRKPDCSFDPWQYAGFCEGDHYTKKTCLWTGGGFVMPEPKPLPREIYGEPDDRIHKASPGEGRKAFRSRTPAGFAQAVYEANR